MTTQSALVGKTVTNVTERSMPGGWNLLVLDFADGTSSSFTVALDPDQRKALGQESPDARADVGVISDSSQDTSGDTTGPSHWDEDPVFSVKDWKYEVANDDTRLGYQAWVQVWRVLWGAE